MLSTTMAGRRCIGLQVKNENSCNFNKFHTFPVEGHILVAMLLLKNGAEVNAKIMLGWTPLSMAKDRGHARMVELLKANGAK